MHQFPIFPEKLLNELRAVGGRLRHLRNEYERLRIRPQVHFAELQALLNQLRELQANCSDALLPQFASLLEQVARALEGLGQNLRADYGEALYHAFTQSGKTLSGHYPLYFSGFFALEVNAEQGKAVLWFGNKQEKLATFAEIVPENLVRKVTEEEQKLGSQLPPEALFPKVVQAYERVLAYSRKAYGDPVPICSVLLELNLLLQSPRFLKDPQPQHFRPYRRADFAYDLYRLNRYGAQELFPQRLRLLVARREQTKSREKILWVPEDASGRGSTYADLCIEEGGVA
ncbi:MAG: hypothetical protein N2447_09440 [Thermoanaerobaculum sp.]|nr:hypothetical protein [Thermoanaerobaculum sp.]